MIKNLFAAMAYALISIQPVYAVQPHSPQAQASQATAMMFWAQWCSACRILDPALEQAIANYKSNSGGNVDIVRLDFTEMDIAALTRVAEQADAIGAADYVPLTNIKTGYALIIVEGKVQGRISAGMSEDLIHKAFDAALKK